MNKTQKWQKIAENRLVIMDDMEKQNDALEQQNADLGAVLYDAYSAIITLPTDAMGWTYDDDQKRSSIRDNLLRDMNAELHKVGSLGKEE